MSAFGKAVVICILISFMVLPVKAQIIDTIWTANYWNGHNDTLSHLIETSDKGFLMTGYTEAIGEIVSDINLIKTDSLGVEEWTKIIGDTAHECGMHLLETNDGGYLISAESYSFVGGPSGYRSWIIKTDANGDTLWSHPFMENNQANTPYCAVQTGDSGFAITGRIYVPGRFANAFILKLDRDGVYEWSHTYGSYGYDIGDFITQMPDKGYIVAGYFDNGDGLWAFRTDSLGVTIWDSTYVLSPSYDYAYCACRVDDGIVMTGTVYAAGHIHKIDFDGNTVWSKSTSSYATAELNSSIVPTSDGGFMIGGWLGVAGKNRDYCFIKTDGAGDTLWHFTCGGGDNDHGHSVVETSDGGFALAGVSQSFENGQTTYLVKIGEVTVDADDDTSPAQPVFSLKGNYPNPFNLRTAIEFSLPEVSDVTISIYNLLGEEVDIISQTRLPAGDHVVYWDGTDRNDVVVASGTYFYRIKAGDYSASKTMILLK